MKTLTKMLMIAALSLPALSAPALVVSLDEGAEGALVVIDTKGSLRDGNLCASVQDALSPLATALCSEPGRRARISFRCTGENCDLARAAVERLLACGIKETSLVFEALAQDSDAISPSVVEISLLPLGLQE